MANMLNSVCSPVSSSPLRKKSIISQRIHPTLSENDDEAERLARRSEISDHSTTPMNSREQRRSSFGLSSLGQISSSQMAERIAHCIKLNAENKINSKNAFRLEMIDFMTYMIKKKDANMTNLQVASTSLDVSTKIYGFRVDGIHMDMLKLVGGLDKQDKGAEKQNDSEELDCVEDKRDNENRDKSKSEKKKKKAKKQIFATVEALKGRIETEKPSSMTMELDTQTTDTLYQVMLPNHADSRFYLHPYDDVLLDTVNRNNNPDKRTVCDVPGIKGISEMELCPPLFYFNFHSKDVEDESNETSSEEQENNEDRFQFDLGASISHEDEHVPTDMNHYDDVELTDEENRNRCAMIPNRVENIVDFRQVLTDTVPSQVSEYSFINKNTNLHWAGPSHWKLNNLKTILSTSNAKNQEHRNLQARKKEKIELTVTYDRINAEATNDKLLPSKNKIKLSTKTLRSTWNDEILTLPSDEHYDVINVNKLYIYPKTVKQLENGNNLNTPSLSEPQDYDDMHNENDGSDYCPNVQNEEYSDNNASEDVERQQTDMHTSLVGDNLVAIPKHTKKVPITYSVCAKKVDMKQLKQSIWSCLESENNNNVQEQGQEDVDSNKSVSKSYKDVYKKLPTLLSKTNKESLSFPISFVSLLHLANEKNLELNSSLDMADIVIHQN